MINRYQPHVLVLPEDDANSRLANGFLLDLDQSALTKIQILPEAGGWRAVLDTFQSDHVAEMDRYTERYLVLLIDFDGDEGRVNDARRRIPERLSDRVFILGARTEPEALKRAGLGSYETIGRAIAEDCREETDKTWGHNLLRHKRTRLTVCASKFGRSHFSLLEGGDFRFAQQDTARDKQAFRLAPPAAHDSMPSWTA